MIDLVNIDIEEFKNDIYDEYLKLFPASERKPYKMLEKTYRNGILKIIKIVENDKIVGFILANSLANNACLHIDYFAILHKYQGNGYGTKALQTLKKICDEYYGIFIEVEKEGLGKNDEENKLRKRRINFYERVGFKRLNFDFDVFKVIFSPYILYTKNLTCNDEKIIKDITQIYVQILGKERFENNCKFLME